MTLDAVISALAGFGGSILGAGVAWGMLVQRVRSLETGATHLWDGLESTEARCKERDGRIERDLAHTRSRLDAHLDTIASRGQQ